VAALAPGQTLLFKRLPHSFYMPFMALWFCKEEAVTSQTLQDPEGSEMALSLRQGCKPVVSKPDLFHRYLFFAVLFTLVQFSASSSALAQATFPGTFHEDLQSLKADPSVLKPEIPVPGALEDEPNNNFIRQRFQLQWRPDDRLDLYVIRPRSASKPPVILYLYSFPQDTERFKDDRWCTRVTNEGFAAVGFVSALTGHRYRDRPLKEWFISELRESLVKSAHDVQMILDFLTEHENFDMSRVGMFGQGSGATIAVLASTADPRIRSLHLVTPWGDWPDWMARAPIVPSEERDTYLKAEYLKGIASLDPIRALPKVKAKDVLLQNLRRDAVTPAICEERIEKAAPSRILIDQFGDGRAYASAFAGGKLFDWMKNQLQGNAALAATAKRAQRIQYFPPKEETIH
jgi:pimeloyl-ACP methyl ester carboxylesterase